MSRRYRPGDQRPVRDESGKVVRPGKPSGDWLARFRAPDGRRYGQTFATKGEARAWLAAQETDADRGVWTKPTKATVADALDAWLETLDTSVALGDLRASSAAEYRRNAQTVRKLIGRVRLSDLDAALLERRLIAPLRAQKTRTGRRSPAGVRLVLVPLRLALREARKARWMATDPLADIDRKRLRDDPGETPRRVLSDAEAWRLYSAAEPGEAQAAIGIALGAGLRIGEILGLRGMDLGTATVEVAQAVYRGSVGPPKTRAGLRVVPVLPEYLEALEALYALAADKAQGDLILANRAGRPLYSHNAGEKWLRPALRSAGLDLPPGEAWHTLRHTYATRLAREGVHPSIAAAAAGHASASLTLGTYTHPSPEDVAAAIGRIGGGTSV